MASVAAAVPPPTVFQWAEDMNGFGGGPVASLNWWGHIAGNPLLYLVSEATTGAVKGSSFADLAEADGDMVLDFNITGGGGAGHMISPSTSFMKMGRVHRISGLLLPGSPGMRLYKMGVLNCNAQTQVLTTTTYFSETACIARLVPGTNAGTQAVEMNTRSASGLGGPATYNWPRLFESQVTIVDVNDIDGDGAILELGSGQKPLNPVGTEAVRVADNLPGDRFIDITITVDPSQKGVANQTHDWKTDNSWYDGGAPVTWNGTVENWEQEYTPFNVVVQYRDDQDNVVTAANADLGMGMVPGHQVQGNPKQYLVSLPGTTGFGWVDFIDTKALAAPGDTDGDGDVDATDQANFAAMVGWGDFDQDGTSWTAADQALLTANLGLDDSAQTLGSSGTLMARAYDYDITIPGDADHDGDVDIFEIVGDGIDDLSMLIGGWGMANPSWRDGDFDGDGDVDVFELGIIDDGVDDLSLLISNWGLAFGEGAEPVAAVAAGTAELTYDAVTGEVTLDCGSGLVKAQIVSVGNITAAEVEDYFTLAEFYADSDAVIYFSTAGLPTGPDAIGDFLATGLTANDISFLVQAQGGTLTAMPVTIIPEPATLALLAMGGLGVLLRRRRS
jgi:hypothetical protein